MKYSLRVSQASALPETIRLEATSADEAKRLAEREGYIVLNVKAAGMTLKRQRFPLLLFCQELTVLLNSGLLLTEALQTLSKKDRQIDNRAVIDRLLLTVSNGQSLSDALAADPAHFSSLFVAMVKACETTGDLAEGLTRFSHYLENIDVLRKKVISASIYPAVILGFGLIVLLFLLGYVVPRFSQIYQSRDTELSLASTLLLKAGNFVQANSMILGLVLVAGGILAIYLFNRPSFKAILARWITSLPMVGERVFIYHLSRFYRTFAMLLRSGIPVVPALSMVSELLGQTLQYNVDRAKQQIIAGDTFSQAMTESSLVTPVAAQLFQVGERSGNLDAMMERAAIFHEEEMMRWVDAFSKTVEPILMALLGIVIGAIVFLMYLPIFELASGIG